MAAALSGCVFYDALRFWKLRMLKKYFFFFSFFFWRNFDHFQCIGRIISIRFDSVSTSVQTANGKRRTSNGSYTELDVGGKQRTTILDSPPVYFTRVNNGIVIRDTILIYITTQVILAFWFVLAYDLLVDRCTIDVIITKFFPLCFKMVDILHILSFSV